MAVDLHQQILTHLVEEKEDGSKVRIYRVPHYLKDRSADDFRPHELFVGFYTHTSLVLDDAMHLDVSKLAIARELCRGRKGPPTSVKQPIEPRVWEDTLMKIGAELQLAREMYDSLKRDASAVEKEKAVIALDALFIVAYLRYNYSFDDTWGYDFQAVFQRSRFNTQRFPLLHDLLMLENQVPMPRGFNYGDSLSTRTRFRIPSATNLRRVGISVRVKESSLTISNIKFERRKHKYVLLVPKLIINDYTSSVFRNLALYEQIKENGVCPRGDMRIYLCLMSSLLDSEEDVRMLVNCGVIVNELGSTEAVWKEWNQMCDGLYIPSCAPAYWSNIQDRIDELEKSKSNRWFAEIEERNCSSLAIFVSFVIVSLVFIATVLSAIFQVLAYDTM
ncbi:hypothetical protein Mapa_000482 [Marchantia paleacea]|nr:hypothetical protein Mapa_000482 [Marchantia paleacea]